jgi:hypothetical protein
MEIFVNGSACQLEGGVLTYDRAVKLADTGRTAVHSVSYRRGATL